MKAARLALIVALALATDLARCSDGPGPWRVWGVNRWIRQPSASSQRVEATSFYYNGRSIAVGDRQFEVMRDCGPPTWRERRSEEVLRHVEPGVWVVEEVLIEEWFYDFGPRSFTRNLIFHNGRLVAVEQGGYGGYQADESSPADRLRKIQVGDRRSEVLLRCGPPDYESGHRETRPVRTGGTNAVSVSVHVQERTYNLGQSSLLRTLHLENSEVVAIETGGYGFSRQGNRGTDPP